MVAVGVCFGLDPGGDSRQLLQAGAHRNCEPAPTMSFLFNPKSYSFIVDVKIDEDLIACLRKKF